MSESLTSGFLRLPFPGQRWVDLEDFGTGVFDDTIATIYTVPNNVNAQAGNTVTERAILVDLWICNTDDSAHTVTLHFVPNGGSPSASNARFFEAPIKANETWHFSNMRTRLPNGGTIRGLADVADLISFQFTGEMVR